MRLGLAGLPGGNWDYGDGWDYGDSVPAGAIQAKSIRQFVSQSQQAPASRRIYFAVVNRQWLCLEIQSRLAREPTNRSSAAAARLKFRQARCHRSGRAIETFGWKATCIEAKLRNNR